MSAFLQFTVEETLAGRGESLKETTIEKALFDRSDARNNSAVRTTASRVRASLEGYYQADGRADRILIDLPRGTYVSTFSFRDPDPPPSPPLQPPRGRPARKVISASLGLFILLAGLWAWRRPPLIQAPPPDPAPRRFFAMTTKEGGSLRRIPAPRRVEEMILSRDGRTIWVSALDGESLFIFRTAELRFDGEIRLPQRLQGVPQLSRNGERIYLGSFAPGVMVFDTKSEKIERVIPTRYPVAGLAVTPDEKRLYLGYGDNGLERLDLTTGETRQMSRLRWAGHLLVDREGRFLYLHWEGGGPGGRPGHDVLEVYDLRTEQPVHRMDNYPMVGGRLLFTPQEELMWVSTRDACTRDIYDRVGCPPNPQGRPFLLWRPADRHVMGMFDVPLVAGAASFLPRTSRVMLVGNDVVMWDWARQHEIERLSLPQLFGFAAILPDESRAIAVVNAEPFVAVFDAEPEECRPPAAGLVNFYTADGVYQDSEGSGRLVGEGGVRFAAGRVGQSFELDGRGQVRAADAGAPWCPYCVNRHTESFWVKFDGEPAGEVTLLESLLTHEATPRRLLRSGARLVLESRPADGSRGPRTESAPLDWKPGRWHHVALVTDGERRSFWLDGAERGAHQVGGIPWGPAPVRLGAGLRGRLDEIAVFNRVLSPAEIGRVARGCPGVVSSIAK